MNTAQLLRLREALKLLRQLDEQITVMYGEQDGAQRSTLAKVRRAANHIEKALAMAPHQNSTLLAVLDCMDDDVTERGGEDDGFAARKLAHRYLKRRIARIGRPR